MSVFMVGLESCNLAILQENWLGINKKKFKKKRSNIIMYRANLVGTHNLSVY